MVYSLDSRITKNEGLNDSTVSDSVNRDSGIFNVSSFRNTPSPDYLNIDDWPELSIERSIFEDFD